MTYIEIKGFASFGAFFVWNVVHEIWDVLPETCFIRTGGILVNDNSAWLTVIYKLFYRRVKFAKLIRKKIKLKEHNIIIRKLILHTYT